MSMRNGILIAAVLMAGTSPGQQAVFKWPDGAKAAVALTYDDGLDVHLDHVVPDLEAAHLRGTFYVPGYSESLSKRMEEWRAVARSGHELGNHTLFHPCLRRADGRERAFVVPERDLGNYTVRRIADEIRVMNALLLAVDGLNARTLAYTCGDEIAGGVSYVDAIRPLFRAARAYKDGYRALADPRTLDLHRVPSWALKDNTATEMTAWVEEAMPSGALAVFTFHGVGGGHDINVAREEHRKFLSWLDANRSRVWTAPFLRVMEHVTAERKRLGIAPR
jgi:peptidoglycan/xylan/chitin deacetylase (PgdA/CDA1 family)